MSKRVANTRNRTARNGRVRIGWYKQKVREKKRDRMLKVQQRSPDKTRIVETKRDSRKKHWSSKLGRYLLGLYNKDANR